MLNYNHSPQDYLPCLMGAGYDVAEANKYYRYLLAVSNRGKIRSMFDVSDAQEPINHKEETEGKKQ